MPAKVERSSTTWELPRGRSWPACQLLPPHTVATMAQACRGALIVVRGSPSQGATRRWWSPGHGNRPLPCGQWGGSGAARRRRETVEITRRSVTALLAAARRWKAGATTKTTPARRLRLGRKDRASPSGGAGLMRRVAPHRPAPGLPAGDARCICTSTASAPRTWPPRHPGQRCLRGATSTRSRRLGRPTPPRSGAGARGTAPSKPGLCGDLLAELRLGHAGEQVSGWLRGTE